MINSRCIPLFCLTYVAVTSAIALAQTPSATEEAQRLYESAQANMTAGNHERAAIEFEAADARAPSAVARYGAANAWALARREDRAANNFTAALALEGLPSEIKQAARERLAVLQLSLGIIDVVTPGYLVQVDDNAAQKSPFQIFAKQGNHRLSFRLQGKPVRFKEVGVLIGQATPVTFEEPTPPVITETNLPLPPPRSSWWSTKNVIGVGLTATGVTAVGVGAFFGLRASRLSDENQRFPTTENAREGRSAQLFANTFYISGAVLTTAGIALILWPTAGKSAAKEMLASGTWSF